MARETLKGLLAHWLAKRRQRLGSHASANGEISAGKDIAARSLTHSRIDIDANNTENDSVIYPPFEFSKVAPPSIITEGSQGGPWRKKITDLDGTEDEKDFPWWCLDCVLNNRLPPRENTKYMSVTYYSLSFTYYFQFCALNCSCLSCHDSYILFAIKIYNYYL